MAIAVTILVLTVLVALPLVVGYLQYKSVSRILTWLRTGNRVYGTVVAYEEQDDSDGVLVWAPVVQYELKGKRRRITGDFGSLRWWLPRIGSRKLVLISNRDPDDAQLWSLSLHGLIVHLLALALCTVFFLCVIAAIVLALFRLYVH